MLQNKFLVIRDTREKPEFGWTFPEDSHCKGTVIRKLHTGDYSIEGLEKFVCVERKQTIDEFAKNCVEKRWVKCMERMSLCDHKFLIFEFSLNDINRYPHSSRAPEFIRRKIRVSAAFIRKNIHKARDEYNIHVLACNNAKKAELVAYRILKKAHELRCRRS